MREVKNFPYRVKAIEHTWIPLKDGGRLAARIWLPENANKHPVPALLEYIPYRKRDITRRRDAINHPYLAGHGYACVRVDLRGSGESSGVLRDEYAKQERFDGYETIEWISNQPWCDGSVGMFGISWGGFNSLQIASLRPPSLRAIITACSTDDLYVDNMHYMGGCLLSDNLSEATVMLGFNSLPPDPVIVGNRWRDMWHERLEGSGLWIEKWLKHQYRDEYWKDASVCEDYSSIQCPVMAVSGWTDGYTNAVFRLLEHLQVPRKGLVGPWGHKYPHMGIPGPAIGFLQECLRWWDYWLKGQETKIMEEPMIKAWMQESVPPTTSYTFRPGRWITENSWPSKRIKYEKFFLGDRTMRRETGHCPVSELKIRSPLTVGLFAGKWCSYTATPDLPHDQRQEDGGALTFDSLPLSETTEVLGSPTLVIELSANEPSALVAARLIDVAPDDKATRVTYGVLNLTHRDGNELPTPLEPGKRYKIKIDLNYLAQTFPAGHRLRLSLSTSYWPLVWPSPRPVQLTLFPENSYFEIPVRPAKAEEEMVEFGEPEGARPIITTRLETPHYNWWVHRDLAKDVSTLEVINDNGRYRLEEIDLEIVRKTNEWYSSRADDFTSARGETQTYREFKRADWNPSVETRTVLTCDEKNFYINAELDAYENDTRVYSQNWNKTIERKLV